MANLDLSPEAQAVIQSYAEEFAQNESQDIAKKAEAILRGDLEAMAEQMVHDALHEPDVDTRFKIQKFIFENLVWPSGKRSGGRDEFTDLLDRIKVDTPEAAKPKGS